MNKEHPLVTEYRTTIPAKLDVLKNLISELKISKSIESMQELRHAVHKMAGNAGTYGFMKVSENCKILDIRLQAMIESFSQDQITSAWLSSLDTFLQKISKDFQNPDTVINF